MAVLINFKICDNVPECPCIQVCPVKAIFWNEKEKKLSVDNDKCTNCRACEKECPVDAIKVAENKEDYKRIEKEIDEDTRKVSDLFVDKYGAQPLDPEKLILFDKFNEAISSENITVIEVFDFDTLECLLCSIPIKDLFPNSDMRYRKINIKGTDLASRFGIKQTPCLLFFKEGELMGKIEGYFDRDEYDKISKKIKKILN